MSQWQFSLPPSHSFRYQALDVNDNPELCDHTEVELPLIGWHQMKTDTLGASLYCILLVTYAVMVIVSWLPVSIHLAEPALFSACNLILLVSTGLSQVQCTLGVDYLSAIQDCCLWHSSIVGCGSMGCTPAEIGHPVFAIASMLVTLWLLVLGCRVFILVQILWTGFLVGIFIYKVHGHNTSNCEPDAVNTLYSALRPPSALDDISYVDRHGLAEQQAVLLQYQQDNLQHFRKEILHLQESLSKYERMQDGSTPQVDLVHMLAAREQELRAITAERDQLQVEVRLARGLISERDADILQVRAINDQYIEENDRVRAMLDEWSTRATKLELALESKQKANGELLKKIKHHADSSTELS
ncbi:hypothetical protein BDL97_12G036800 [Sphagnum fallax]|nr:hypothetical protein BDL97_12G036800 [Sphagnum fallax]